MGVAPKCRILPIYTNEDGDVEDVVQNIKDSHASILLVTMDFNGDPTWSNFIDTLAADNVLTILAYGNDGSYNEVASTNPLRCAGNYGLYKSLRSSMGATGVIYPDFTAAAPMGGFTSFAASVAAGIAGLTKTVHSDLNFSQFRDKVAGSCTPLADPNWSETPSISKLGNGRLDAYVAVANTYSGAIDENATWSGPIYLSDDVYINQGYTVVISLPSSSSEYTQTHVRMASEKPNGDTAISTIHVYGNLVIEGSAENPVLLGALRKRYYNGTTGEFYRKWGGIYVHQGGTLTVNHAVIEDADQPIRSDDPRVLVQNSELCTFAKTGIYIADAQMDQNGPIVKKCQIHDGTGSASVGVSIYQGYPKVDSCRIWKVATGVHATSPSAYGEVRNSVIELTADYGVLLSNGAVTRITKDSIMANLSHGVGVSWASNKVEIDSSYIVDNGLNGLYGPSGVRDGDGIRIWGNITYLMHNYLDRSTRGIYIGSHGSLRGGNGMTGPNGQYGFNVIRYCDTAIAPYERSTAYFGFKSEDGSQRFGGGNSFRDCAMWTGGRGNGGKILSLQCNLFDLGAPNNSKFVSAADWYPILTDCDNAFGISDPIYATQSRIIRDLFSSQLDSAIVRNDSLMYQGDFDLLDISLAGLNDISAADETGSFTNAITTRLQNAATFYQGAPSDVRSAIALTQGMVAIRTSDYAATDSVLRYATTNFTDAQSQVASETGMLYLRLYLQNDISRADSVLSDIYARFPDDPRTNDARMLRKYYIYPETGFYLPRTSTVSDNGVTKNIPAAEVMSIEVRPNPIRDVAIVALKLAVSTEVSLSVFNILGKKVATLHNGYVSEGQYSYLMNARGLPTGMYFVIAESQNQRIVSRLNIRK